MKFWNFTEDDKGERILRLEGPIDSDNFWGDEVCPRDFREELNFTVRYCEKTAQVTPTEYRIFFNGRAYDIERVDIMALHKRSLKFMAVLR